MKTERSFLRKGLLVLVCGLLLAMLMGMGVQAATYKGMKEGRTYGKFSGTNYFRINVKRSGCLSIQAYRRLSSGATAKASVGLYNSRGKAVDKYWRPTSKKNNYAVYYGVKKGTYYIAMKGSSGCYIKYKFTSVSENSGSTRSKSKTIAENANRNGILTAGESGRKSDWYKIRVVNRSSIALYFDSLNNGGKIAVQVYSPRLRFNKTYVSTGDWAKRFSFSSGKKIRGMFYIRVYRYQNNSATSGAYTLRWT